MAIYSSLCNLLAWLREEMVYSRLESLSRHRNVAQYAGVSLWNNSYVLFMLITAVLLCFWAMLGRKGAFCGFLPVAPQHSPRGPREQLPWLILPCHGVTFSASIAGSGQSDCDTQLLLLI